MTMTEPDMTNKLALVQRENVIRLMKFHDLKPTELGRLTGLSGQTMQNNFGGKTMKGAPSIKTMTKIAKAFDLDLSLLDKANSSILNARKQLRKEDTLPTPKPKVQEPVVVPQTRIQLQIGKTSIDTTVDAETAQRVLKLIVLGDDI